MRLWGRDDGEPDEVVRQRFIRVVGLPESDDEPAQPLVGVGSAPAGMGSASAVGSASVGDGPAPGVGSAVPGGGFRGRVGLAAFSPGRQGVRALAVVAALAVAIAAVLAWRARPQPEPVAARAQSSAATTVASSPSTSGLIVVAVAGRVRHPGLVRLPAGARVADALDAAGGALPGTDLSFLNVARRLVDGELLLIGATPPPGAVDPGPGGQGLPPGKVNLNTATLAQLETLPGVGPVLAQHIVDFRTRHGGFRSVTELRQVDGVGDARYAQLKELVEA
jgi:competence protein ComEA